MKTIKNSKHVACNTICKLIVVVLLTVAISCDATINTPPMPEPTIGSIDPESGPKATLVTISGSNFGSDISMVKVFFNENEAQVQSVDDTKITAKVPLGAGTGVVKVEIGSVALTGPEFSYILTAEVTTLAGSTPGFADGPGSSAQFNHPRGVAIDGNGIVYVANSDNHKIRTVTPAGEVGTLAGSSSGFVDDTGTNAQFNFPAGVAADASGNVYVADIGNNKIRKITPAGDVTTLAGSSKGFADGSGSNAKFHFPPGVAIDGSGNVYVADVENHKIRKITPNGEVSTLAGSNPGFEDAVGTNAQFNNPTGVAVDAQNNVFVADVFNHKIRKINQGGEVSTIAGSTQGFADGTGANAQFNNPTGVAVDVEGNIYVADRDNHKIRKITPTGQVSTLAGSTEGFAEGAGKKQCLVNLEELGLTPKVTFMLLI